MTNRNASLGRQPILDADRRTFGYELQYRNHPATTEDGGGPADSGQILMGLTVLDWGMQRLVGDRFGFIRATIEGIGRGVHRALPPEATILQLDVRELSRSASLDSLNETRREGYHFCFEHVDKSTAHMGLLHMASTLKVTVGPTDHLDLCRRLRHANPRALLLADQVNSAETFAKCKSEGFDLFQGHFFARPEVLSRTSRRSGSTAAMALLAEMNEPQVTVERAEELIAADPALAFRILSVVNSSAFGLDRQVDSLRQAVVLVGLTQIRHLSMLMAICSEAGVSEELVVLGATRARFASALAVGERERSQAFTLGLLSVADAIFSTPMSQLVEDLPLTDDVAEALVSGTGPLGRILDLVRACETNDLSRLGELAEDEIEHTLHLHEQSRSWADQLRNDLPATLRRTSTLDRPSCGHEATETLVDG